MDGKYVYVEIFKDLLDGIFDFFFLLLIFFSFLKEIHDGYKGFSFVENWCLAFDSPNNDLKIFIFIFWLAFFAFTFVLFSFLFTFWWLFLLFWNLCFYFWRVFSLFVTFWLNFFISTCINFFDFLLVIDFLTFSSDFFFNFWHIMLCFLLWNSHFFCLRVLCLFLLFFFLENIFRAFWGLFLLNLWRNFLFFRGTFLIFLLFNCSILVRLCFFHCLLLFLCEFRGFGDTWSFLFLALRLRSVFSFFFFLILLVLSFESSYFHPLDFTLMDGRVEIVDFYFVG